MTKYEKDQFELLLKKIDLLTLEIAKLNAALIPQEVYVEFVPDNRVLDS